MQNIDYKKELNDSQLQAVQATEGPYLVIAGAGSGKTRTLIFRVAFLVEKGVRPDEILLLTFTRKAAEEMLRRASFLLDERCSRVAGGTFHSFANMVLRKYARVLGVSNNFSILDESDAQDTVNLLRTQLGFNKAEKRFPRKGAILEVISKSINKARDLEQVLYEEFPHFIEWTKEIKQIRDEYVKHKHLRSLFDYDDLLVHLRDLLLNHEHIRLTLSEKYRYIMVDEYQDTNKLQAHIVSLLSVKHKNIMVVGDDSQSIYSFRGANFKNIIDFPMIFENAKIITLEENYRSTQPILNLANELIGMAKEKFNKALFTKRKGNRRPVFIDAPNEHAQSRFIAERILELREEGIELKDMAVLFRSSWHSNDLEIELSSRNIPFTKYGGQKFVEAAHIKDVISYLRIIYNLCDEVSWYRILLFLPGVGPKTAQRIINEVIVGKKGLEISDKFVEKIEGLKKLFGIFKKIDIAKQLPSELIRIFLEYYRPFLKEKYDDFPKRINDLDSLEKIAVRYKSLEQFLADMAIDPPEKNIIEAGFKDKDDSRLTLSTIHSAKGLEWHSVFIIYVADGYLPSYLSLENEDALEEERRLLYVAVTRAKENLFLLKPHLERSGHSYFNEGGIVFTKHSRFLDEGDILNRSVDVETVEEEMEADNFSDSVYRKEGTDKEFLDMLKDYFER